MEGFGGVKRLWVASVLAVAGIAPAPVAASESECPRPSCSIQIDKTVALDDNCDGRPDGAFVDSVSQEIDQCVVYRICVTNSGLQDLIGTGVLVNDAKLGVVNLNFGTVPWSAEGPVTECQYVPEDAPATACSTYPDTCVCEEVEGTNTAYVRWARCALTDEDACSNWTSDCEDTATVACVPGEGCLTRTPGFWGTHPDVTARFLSVTSCGLSLSTTTLAVEDLCSIGRDGDLYPSRQSAQLVRQCAAAALNIAASAELGGSCSAALSPARFQACCGSAAICASVPAGCIEDLDRFNNSTDTLTDALGKELSLCAAPPCAAEPLQCRIAGGNDFINVR